MPPDVLRFAADGTYQASYDLPEGLLPEDGLTGIALVEDGALLAEMEGGRRLYQLINAAGEIDRSRSPTLTRESRSLRMTATIYITLKWSWTCLSGETFRAALQPGG